MPWQLRALPAPTAIRVDDVVALTEDAESRRGVTSVTILTVAARIPGTGPPRAGLDLMARGAFATASPPSGRGGWTVANVLLGAAYAIRLPQDFLLNAFVGVTLPVGMGGGYDPDASALAARTAAPLARSQLDNSLFAVNDVGIVPGLGAGWVARGWTLQIEGTLTQSLRNRGANAQPDARKTNLALGAHVGFFVAPFLSLNTELRYQRWINPPFAVEHDASGHSIDTLTVAVGPRLHVDTGVGWLRPGLAYVRGLDKPMAAASLNAHMIHVDLPFFF